MICLPPRPQNPYRASSNSDTSSPPKFLDEPSGKAERGGVCVSPPKLGGARGGLNSLFRLLKWLAVSRMMSLFICSSVHLFICIYSLGRENHVETLFDML